MIFYLVYGAIGRICIFFLQKFPFSKLPILGSWFNERGFLYELFQCDLCLGVWVFTFLAWAFKLNLLQPIFYMPFVSELLTGATMSLIVHLIRVGFETQFSVIEVK